MSLPHPLASLLPEEISKARDFIVNGHKASDRLSFRAIHLQEPKKEELLPFLHAEHNGTLTSETKRPAREAQVEYDILKEDHHQLVNAVVDLETGKISSESIHKDFHPSITIDEFTVFEEALKHSEEFKEAMSEYSLPEGFSIVADPWPYGGQQEDEDVPRYMQGLIFAKDTTKSNPDSNHYGYPIPLIPIMDWTTKKVVRVDRIATGGKGDNLLAEVRGTEPTRLFDDHKHADYIPELLDIPLRQDLKPINITQPEGASFTVQSDGLIEWQKWRFRVGFTPREGAVLHDVCYDNRPILYRVSYSEMTVPYADPRHPFERKQAFDFGDAGIGRAANNLELGCDCLGAIHYMDTQIITTAGSPETSKAVICLHEQDNGILWKHTNYRTNRAAVTRNREFVVQFIATLANYEYIFAYKLDLAGGITLETRATGIVSVTGIDYGKTAPWGNIVSPGILAQNHQHIFAIRIDPSIDSYNADETRVVIEESMPRKIDPETNPFGNYYEIERSTVTKANWFDAKPQNNRVIKLENTINKNAVSGKNVAYKVISPPTQLLLADIDSIMAKRARFAQHHFWVTGHRDGELWAAGEYTNQTKVETGGVDDMVKRGDWFSDEAENEGGVGAKKSSPVLWTVFGLTHNPRVEDWPIMPVEIYQTHLRPTDFFTYNPALDVPSTKNEASVLVSCCSTKGTEAAKTNGKHDPVTHLQGHLEMDANAAGAHVNGH